jgi:hypothetical protein
MNEFQLNFIPNEEDIQIISKILDTNTYLEPSLINSYLDNLSIHIILNENKRNIKKININK